MRTTHNRSTAFLRETIRTPPSPRQDYHESEGRADNRVEESEIVPGRIFWLPSEENVPERAVRVVRGKGAVQDGIYSHPVVITSRPAEGGHVVHFHLVRSHRPQWIVFTNPTRSPPCKERRSINYTTDRPNFMPADDHGSSQSPRHPIIRMRIQRRLGGDFQPSKLPMAPLCAVTLTSISEMCMK